MAVRLYSRIRIMDIIVLRRMALSDKRQLLMHRAPILCQIVHTAAISAEEHGSSYTFVHTEGELILLLSSSKCIVSANMYQMVNKECN
jgi:hypothetical protein